MQLKSLGAAPDPCAEASAAAESSRGSAFRQGSPLGDWSSYAAKIKEKTVGGKPSSEPQPKVSNVFQFGGAAEGSAPVNAPNAFKDTRSQTQIDARNKASDERAAAAAAGNNVEGRVYDAMPPACYKKALEDSLKEEQDRLVKAVVSSRVPPPAKSSSSSGECGGKPSGEPHKDVKMPPMPAEEKGDWKKYVPMWVCQTQSPKNGSNI